MLHTSDCIISWGMPCVHVPLLVMLRLIIGFRHSHYLDSHWCNFFDSHWCNLLRSILSLGVQNTIFLILPFVCIYFFCYFSVRSLVNQPVHFPFPRSELWLSSWHCCVFAALLLMLLWEIAWNQGFRGRFLPSFAVNFWGNDNYKQCQLYALAVLIMVWYDLRELKGRPDENIFLFSCYIVSDISNSGILP